METSGERRQAARVGVVIPARDEAVSLGKCIGSLSPFLRAGDPVVVVDAASRDATARVAAEAGAEVIRAAEPARGLAVEQGYRHLAGRVDLVLIVHADMTVPAGARERILEAVAASPHAVGGALGHRIDAPGTVFRWLERGNRFRATRWQIPYGDQAQFVRRASVEEGGGFPRMDRLEDLEISLRLRKLGRWLYLDCPVTIPDRHWSRGVVLTTARNWFLVLAHRVRRWWRGGVPA
jgi:glycosyltransferase involved in cell wall biosynthesis